MRAAPSNTLIIWNRSDLTILVTITVCILLQMTAAAESQAQSTDHFTGLKAWAIEGRPRELNAKVSSLFGIPNDIRVVEASKMVLPLPPGPGTRRLWIAFSTSTDDIFLMDSKTTSTGTVMTVFHADHLKRVLRSAASGVSFDDLRLMTHERATDTFREVLMLWDAALPTFLKHRK